MINWADVRKQFPVTQSYVYLNAAAAGPLAVSTQRAAAEYYELMMNEGDVQWDHWLEKREQVRARVAAFINAEPDEIGFTTNTSSGMNLIIDALESQREVISSELEFPVSTLPWMHRGMKVRLVNPVDGVVRLDDLHEAIDGRPKILSLSYVQYSNGFRLDLDQLASIKEDCTVVINASQAAGVFEIDVKRMKIDALCTTGHKWMLAGYGSGFVYLSRELQQRSRPRSIGWLSVDEPYAMRNNEVHLRNDASARAELGCPHFAGIFALGASVELMLELGIRNIEERALSLNRRLTERLIGSGWQVLSPLQDEQFRSAQTLVRTDNPSQVVAALAENKVLVTEKPEGIRIATDFFNNEDDFDQLLESLNNLQK